MTVEEIVGRDASGTPAIAEEPEILPAEESGVPGASRPTADSDTSNGGLLGLLGGLDPKVLGGILELLLGSGGGGEQDHREELLDALRPYLSPERQGGVDRARSAYRMARTAQTALKLFEK
jgi:hypothetical protein